MHVFELCVCAYVHICVGNCVCMHLCAFVCVCVSNGSKDQGFCVDLATLQVNGS